MHMWRGLTSHDHCIVYRRRPGRRCRRSSGGVSCGPRQPQDAHRGGGAKQEGCPCAGGCCSDMLLWNGCGGGGCCPRGLLHVKRTPALPTGAAGRIQEWSLSKVLHLWVKSNFQFVAMESPDRRCSRLRRLCSDEFRRVLGQHVLGNASVTCTAARWADQSSHSIALVLGNASISTRLLAIS